MHETHVAVQNELFFQWVAHFSHTKEKKNRIIFFQISAVHAIIFQIRAEYIAKY